MNRGDAAATTRTVHGDPRNIRAAPRGGAATRPRRRRRAQVLHERQTQLAFQRLHRSPAASIMSTRVDAVPPRSPRRCCSRSFSRSRRFCGRPRGRSACSVAATPYERAGSRTSPSTFGRWKTSTATTSRRTRPRVYTASSRRWTPRKRGATTTTSTASTRSRARARRRRRSAATAEIGLGRRRRSRGGVAEARTPAGHLCRLPASPPMPRSSSEPTLFLMSTPQEHPDDQRRTTGFRFFGSPASRSQGVEMTPPGD